MKSTIAKYLHSLVSRLTLQRDADTYSKITQSRAIYYSIHTPQQVGFTDQTLLVASLYKLGTLLELNYHFTPVHPSTVIRHTGISNDLDWNEESAGEYSGIFDYVGFDEFYSSRSTIASVEGMSSVDIIFARDRVCKQQITNSEDMIRVVKKRILKALPENGEALHVRLEIAKQGDVVDWLLKIPNRLLSFDYTEIYWNRRAARPTAAVFDGTTPKLLMHIRQGDTAVIETPWKSYVQIWGKGKDAYFERPSVAEIQDDVVITVADFENFYSKLKSHLAEPKLATLVHSDGFSRAFLKLNKRIDRLNLSPDKIEQLQQYADGYNDRAFEVFQPHAEAKLFIGEDLNLLYELMHAFYTCDIVVVGTQQRMLVKQYAYSFPTTVESRASPLLITLYKREPPDYALFNNEHMLEQSLLVDLTDYDITRVADSVQRFLASRD